MKWSLCIGKISGIKIFIHWTFFILIFWIIFSGVRQGYNAEDILLNLGLVVSVFACIVLHEMGHAITAKRFNFKTRDIILLPIGGLARMEGLPDKPLHEFLVAIMGPVVNLAISLILFIFLKMTDNFPDSISELSALKMNFGFQLCAVNLFLALFNLIPAFPMDGGRILRALLSVKLQRVKATRIAAYIGQGIATLFVLVGFFSSPILVLIGFFVFIGALAEVRMEEAKSILGNIKVKDLLMRKYSVLHPDEPLSKAVSLLLDSQEKSFIVKDNGDIKGTLSKKEIIAGLSNFGKEIQVQHVMQKQIFPIHEQDNIHEVMQKFSGEANTLMPVFDGKELAGVLDLENIAEFIQIQTALIESERSVAD